MYLCLLAFHIGGVNIYNFLYIKSKSKSKAIALTGCGGLYGCEMLRILHYLDNRLTDGGEVVGLTHTTP
jgi:hypothetical protein